jgi:hypothetical protein
MIAVLLIHAMLATAPEPSNVAPAGPPGSKSVVLRIPHDDPITRDKIVYLIAHSPTARELVTRVGQLQDCVLIIRARPLLARQEKLLGRGRFWVARGYLYGLLEYQTEPRGSYFALRVIAHELAHALEVGLTARATDTASLRPLVLAREREKDHNDPRGIETEFARAVGYRVQLELLDRSPGASSLAALAGSTHLSLNAAIPYDVFSGVGLRNSTR